MFKSLESHFIDLKKQPLVQLFQSLNQPPVSPGAGIVAQAASSYLIVVKSSESILQVYVALFFPESEKRMVYMSDIFQEASLAEKIAEAEAFVGQMGFLMDDTHFSEAGESKQKELLRTVPFFYKEMDLYKKALSTAELQAKKGKTEASANREAQADLQRVFLEQYVRMVSML